MSFQEQDFEPLSYDDIDGLKNFGTVSIPPYISRVVKQVHDIHRPRTMKVKRKTLMNGLPIYELEYGVGVVVKNDRGLWLLKSTPQLMNELSK